MGLSFASGAESALEEAYRRWSGLVFTVALRTLGNRSDAEDVVQETFLRAYREIGRFESRAHLSSWLYRITLNLCRDWMRRERRAPVPVQTVDAV